VVRNANGRAVGTGALALDGAWAELKRMWVIPEARRLGISKIILAALEAHARDEGIRILRLENRRGESCRAWPLRESRLQAPRSLRRLPSGPAERFHAERALKWTLNDGTVRIR
jgi:GNAT superfamily N-acetyltransferase